MGDRYMAELFRQHWIRILQHAKTLPTLLEETKIDPIWQSSKADLCRAPSYLRKHITSLTAAFAPLPEKAPFPLYKRPAGNPIPLEVYFCNAMPIYRFSNASTDNVRIILICAPGHWEGVIRYIYNDDYLDPVPIFE